MVSQRVKNASYFLGFLLACTVLLFGFDRFYQSYDRAESTKIAKDPHDKPVVVRKSIYEDVRKQRLHDNRNLCWYTNTSRHCIPTVYMPGTMKSGTSFLWTMLDMHPQTGSSKGIKEHDFYIATNYPKGLYHYAQEFEEYDKLLFDVSPKYMLHHECIENLFQTMKTATFVISLRNPVDRAYSHYQYQLKLWYSKGHIDELTNSSCPDRKALSFEQYIQEEFYVLSNCGFIDWATPSPPEEHFPPLPEECRTYPCGINDATGCDLCFPRYRDGLVFSPLDMNGFLSKGFYYNQIAEFFRYYKEDEFMFVRYEDLQERGEGVVLNEICSFLGLDELEWSELTEFPKVNAFDYPDMKNGTRRWLTEFYKEPVKRLETLLNRKMNWK